MSSYSSNSSSRRCHQIIKPTLNIITPSYYITVLSDLGSLSTSTLFISHRRVGAVCARVSYSCPDSSQRPGHDFSLSPSLWTLSLRTKNKHLREPLKHTELGILNYRSKCARIAHVCTCITSDTIRQPGIQMCDMKRKYFQGWKNCETKATMGARTGSHPSEN